MGIKIDNKVKKYVADIIEGSGAKPNDKIKLALLADKFYKDNKESFDLAKVPFLPRKVMMCNSLLFCIQFETICARAFKPFTGSQSTSETIIDIYREIQRGQLFEGTNNERKALSQKE